MQLLGQIENDYHANISQFVKWQRNKKNKNNFPQEIITQINPMFVFIY